MYLVCPHCWNPVEVAQVSTREDVLCPACGSKFRLESNSTIAWSPRERQKLGRFELLGIVGEGGFGTVYRAHDPDLDRTVAIKVPRGTNLPDPLELERFLREARSVAQLQHPSIVTVHEAGQVENLPYLVSDFVEGLTLADLLSGRRPTPRAAAQLIADVADALQYAHERGVIHRDIKPSNIMLEGPSKPAAHGETGALLQGKVRLMDFGLARRDTGETTVTIDGQVLGTPAYMSPEQARGESHSVDGRSDIYSLGVILYEMLTGELPFRGTTRMLLHQVLHDEPKPLRILNDRIPRDLQTICLKAMAKEPRRRYPTAAELSDDLHRFLKDEPIQARPIGRSERLWRWCRRNRAVAALTASVAVLLVFLALGSSLAALYLHATLNESEAHRKRAEEAERVKAEKLWEAYLAQARAGRWSGRPGRRLDSLEALAEAAKLRPSLELRNEAIACLALTDLRVAKLWDGLSLGTRTVAFAPAFDHYARGDEQGTISVRMVADDREIANLPGDGTPALVLRFSPNGRLLAAKYGKENQGPLKIWDLERKATLPNVPDAACHYALDFSPDNRQIAVGRDDGSIIVWEWAAGREAHRVEPGPVPHSLAFHPSGQRLAVSSLQTRVVHIHELATGKVVGKLPHPAALRGMAWRGDGQFFAAACANSRVYVWNMANPPRLHSTLEGHEHVAVHVAFNHRGDLLASNSWDGTVRLWDPYQGKPLIHTPGSNGSLCFSPDDSRLATATDSLQLGYWDVVPSSTFHSIRLNTQRVGRRADISPDGRLLAVAEEDGTHLLDLATRGEAAHLPGSGINECHFHPDGKSLVTSGAAGLHRWPITPAGEKPGLQFGPPQFLAKQPLRSSCLSRDGRFLVVHKPPRQALVFNLENNDVPVVLDGHANLRFVAISPEGKLAATGSWHGTGVKIWDARSGELLHELPVSASAMVAFSPDGKWLVTSTGAEYCFWERETWQPRRRLSRDRGGDLPGFMAFTEDGGLMAVTISRTAVQLVNPATGEPVATLEAPQRTNLDCLCMNSTGRLIVAMSDELAEFWDLGQTRRMLAEMNLDWSLSPLQTPGTRNSMKPVEIKVVLDR